MSVQVAVILTVDVDSQEEANRLVEERAKLKWPPVTDVEVVAHYDLSQSQSKADT